MWEQLLSPKEQSSPHGGEFCVLPLAPRIISAFIQLLFGVKYNGKSKSLTYSNSKSNK